MTDDGEIPAPATRRNTLQWVLVALMLVLVVGTQLFSQRPRLLTNRPWVVPVSDLPERGREDLKVLIDANAYVVPDTRYTPPIGLAAVPDYYAAPSPPMLGYSIREVSVLGMPLFAYREVGFVLYVEGPQNFSMTPLDEDGRRLLDDTVGQPIGRDYSFPWWEYVWGWALFVLIAAWGWVWWRSKVKVREETGLI
jgi:hypothetical protein